MSKLSLKEMIVLTLKNTYPTSLIEPDFIYYLKSRWLKCYLGSTISRKCRELATEGRIVGTLRKDTNYKEWSLSTIEMSNSMRLFR